MLRNDKECEKHIAYLYLLTLKHGVASRVSGMVVLFCLMLSSCSTTKFVPDGQYLLDKNSIKVTEKRTVTVEDLVPYIRQRTNRTSLLKQKFHLWEYNLSSSDTSKWINRKLRSWGEPPVIFDSVLVQNSKDNIQAYMRQRGFYYAEIADTVIYRKKKAEVIYTVTPNQPYRITKVSYDIADSVIRAIVYSDTLSSLLRSRRRLSTAVLESEQNRLTTLLRNQGYYTFNKGFINFEADSTRETLDASIKINIATTYPSLDENGHKTMLKHSVYRVNKVFINTNYNAVKAVSDSSYVHHPFDTLYEKGLYIVYDAKLRLGSGVLSRVTLVEPNALFNEDKASNTYRNLSNLQMFKSVSVQFRDLAMQDTEGNKLLDCLILLDPLPQQSYKLDFEMSSNSSDLIGFSPGFRYAHRNMLGGAEIFFLDFRGIFQYSLPAVETPQSSLEYNISSGIKVPRFLMPVSLSYFKKQLPHTQIAAAYIHQRRPEYRRSLANLSYGYFWRGSPTNHFIFTPLDLSMIKMWELSEDFYKNLNDPYLRATYEDHFILGMNASFIYNSSTENLRQGIRRRRPSFYYRINADVAGNLLSLFNGLMPVSESVRHNNSRTLLTLPYAQFARADINMVYTKPLTFPSNNVVAYRLFFGIGKPYGNSISLPFEKMYYAGGANSLRAWPVRGVGPGSALPDSIAYSFPNQAADLRIEFNVEYRFPIFWFFEGAFFADAGNVWSLNPNARPGGFFRFNSFYKEIAANLGAGLRFNFSYFIFRLDLGTKLYEPALLEGHRFIPPGYWLSGKNKALHFGINYPF